MRRKHFTQRQTVSTQQTPFMIFSPSQPFLGALAEHHHRVSEHRCHVTSVQDVWKVEQKDITYYFLGCAHGDSSGINSLMLLAAYGLGSITIHMKIQWNCRRKGGERKKEIEGECTHPCPKYKLSPEVNPQIFISKVCTQWACSSILSKVVNVSDGTHHSLHSSLRSVCLPALLIHHYLPHPRRQAGFQVLVSRRTN